MNLSSIRNFVIISHIDHGKSTLADRFLEITGTVDSNQMHSCFLDAMDLEKEKGITIKMHPCRMLWKSEETGQEYILNLIDTPGHIDFSYETSRALAAVEGAILLVDASQGIQAQTLFNLEQAKKQNLTIIGVVNKIDLPQAQVAETKKELASILEVGEEEILSISARKGTNVKELLEVVVQKVPCPQKEIPNENLKALIFDSKYDLFSGVTVYVRVFEGQVQKGDKINLLATKIESEVKEVGYFSPALNPCSILKSGEIGYIKTGVKEPSKVHAGDTISSSLSINALPGYKEPQLVLFLSLYPEDSDSFEILKDALNKLKLNDPTLHFEIESKMALGRGFRCGFLGSLHAEITARRLKQEFGLDLVLTSPQVIFKILTKDDKEILVSSPASWPNVSLIKEIQEPWVEVEIISPNSYLNSIFKVLRNFDSSVEDTKFITSQKSLIFIRTSLREIITGNFYDKLKSITQGYASFSFRQIGFNKADLVKLDILINGEKQEAFSKVVSSKNAFPEGKALVSKLKKVLPAQQFSVAIQAATEGRIIARETIKARRKDVTGSLYGGDVTRKRKLLERQKKGKEKLKGRSKINIPSRVFLEMLK
jgi:GTP-binding protein LepA